MSLLLRLFLSLLLRLLSLPCRECGSSQYSNVLNTFGVAHDLYIYQYNVVGVGKERRIKDWSMVTCKMADYWPCAVGLSAVNAIGTRLRDPINSGLTLWRLTVDVDYDAVTEIVRNLPVSKHPIHPGCGE